MASVNSLTIIGRAGKDAEVTVVGNKKLVKFSVATDEYAGKGDDGKGKYVTTWHNVSLWQRGDSTANVDRVAEQVKKGTTVYVEGPMTSRKHEDKFYWELKANNVVVISDSKGANGTSNGNQQQETAQTAVAGAAAGKSRQAPPSDDDIPF